jgi:apolipoprotein N-acyltransferase
MGQARKRLRIEIGLATFNVALFVATLAWSEWIEILFGVDPDQGDSSIEWLIMGMAAALAIAAIFLARTDWRRLNAIGKGPAR